MPHIVLAAEGIRLGYCMVLASQGSEERHSLVYIIIVMLSVSATSAICIIISALP